MAKKLLVDFVVDRYVNLTLFHAKQKKLANGCVEWTGVKNNIGYPFIGFTYPEGVLSPAGRKHGMMLATRLALMIKLGRAIAPGMNANHTCHNRNCMNLDHLTEGTQREKMTAMRKDGKYMGGREPGVPVGSYNHKQYNYTYKYSEEDIQWVRNANTLDIAARYGMTRTKAAAFRWSFRKGYRWLPWVKE